MQTFNVTLKGLILDNVLANLSLNSVNRVVRQII